MGLRVNLKQISAFRAVMVAGSTSAAAELLNVSQPAVSRLIKNFEAQTDFPLFLRQNGRLYPTQEAQVLLREIEQVYGRLDNLDHMMRSIRVLESGHLNIVASTPFGQWLMPQALAQFQQRHPDIRVSVKIVVRRDLAKWLEEQEFDVALITFPVDYPQAHIRTLPSLDAVCIVPADHPLAAARTIQAKDLSGQRFISIIPDTVLRMKVDRIFDRQSIQRSLMTETQSGASICSLVAAGMGVSVVDPVTVGRPDSRPFAVRSFRPTIRFDYGMLLPIQRPVSALAEDFIGVVQQQMHALQKVCRKL
ncbi:LysR family transcriptional regulator [Candidimonas humi]|uniref:LysR substrate-binding domain-containing protein n=1 Tax=Candidimonas humi TaxID=683355 RepID=A0ABV8NU80_9BURK|nr:LysR substrate-binding domain-containing protein [Candidimonas humi]MBV6303780.1 LysR family transcriptional regulator [Candidimonas humi]